MEIMSKAQACLIKCLRISGMTISQITEILEMVWEEDKTLEMLKRLTKEPTLDHKKLYSFACEISEQHNKEVDNNGDIYSRTKIIESILGNYGYVISGKNVSNRNVVGRGSNDRNARVHSENIGR